jgi:putative redox protein
MSMKGKVTWKQRMSFDGKGSRNITVPIGTSSASGGDDDGVSPMELVLISLAGCSAMDVISILEKKRQEVTSFEVEVHGDRADQHPRVYTDIQIEYKVVGKNIDPQAVARAVELSITKYCSVYAMVEKTARIVNKISISEAE